MAYGTVWHGSCSEAILAKLPRANGTDAALRSEHSSAVGRCWAEMRTAHMRNTHSTRTQTHTEKRVVRQTDCNQTLLVLFTCGFTVALTLWLLRPELQLAALGDHHRELWLVGCACCHVLQLAHDQH